MSIRTISELAVERDKTKPGAPVETATNVLVSSIPTEPLAAYTALVGIVLSANVGTAYEVFRWSAFGVFVLLAFVAAWVAYKFRLRTDDKIASSKASQRRLPFPEAFAAALAAAAWGLVMPGSPLATEFKGNALTFATAAITVGGGAALGLLTAVLRLGSRTVPPANTRRGEHHS